MSDDSERHGHAAGDHDHDQEKAPDDGLLFPFLVVLAIAAGVGWLTQPGRASTAASPEPAALPTGEPASAVAARSPDDAPPAEPSPTAPPPQAAAPEESAAPDESAAPVDSAAPPAAPVESAAPEQPAAPGQSAVPEAPAQPSATAPLGAAGGGAFDRIAALTALGKTGQAAGRCRSAGAPSGNAKVIVAFSPDGQVSSARILSAKYIGTPTGNCILGHIKQTTVAPFAGGKPETVLTSVHVY